MNTKKIALVAALAEYAHEGQTDKAGRSYVGHPLAVADMVDGEECKIVALLHDVLEDTFVTEATVRNLFGDEIADAVLAVTRRDGESYDDFIVRAGKNRIARTVKLADLRHNMDLSRLNRVTDEDLKRRAKYEKAYDYLIKLTKY